MNVAQIRCHGCNRCFTQSSLSQHIARTRDTRCRAVYSTSQAQPGFRPIPSANVDHAPSSLAPILTNEDSLPPLHFPEIPGDEYADELPLPAVSDPGQPPAQAGESGVVVIDRFLFGSPGALFFGPHETSPTNVPSSSPAAVDGPNWAPFHSQCDWEVAFWAKMRGPTSSAMSELLAIPEVCPPLFPCYHVTNVSRKVIEKLGLSYQTTKQLNDIIDNNLPQLHGPPPFQCKEFSIGHERLQFFFRDTIQCIRSIYGNPSFMQDLVFAPEQHYADNTRTSRVINEMYTGDWWWNVQVRRMIYE